MSFSCFYMYNTVLQAGHVEIMGMFMSKFKKIYVQSDESESSIQ